MSEHASKWSVSVLNVKWPFFFKRKMTINVCMWTQLVQGRNLGVHMMDMSHEYACTCDQRKKETSSGTFVMCRFRQPKRMQDSQKVGASTIEWKIYSTIRNKLTTNSLIVPSIHLMRPLAIVCHSSNDVG